MKLTKSTEQEEAKSKGSARKKRVLSLPIIGALLGAVIGIVISGVVAYAIYDAQIVKQRQLQMQQLSEQQAQLAASAIGDYFDSLNKKLAYYTGQTLLANALEGGDKIVLDTLSQAIRRQFDSIISVRFFKVGKASLTPDTTPPLRFSELALIKSAEQGAAPVPEATKAEKLWHLNFVVAIQSKHSEHVVGTVWLAIKMDVIHGLLKKNGSAFGQLRLLQNFSAQSRVKVFHVGQASLDIMGVGSVSDTHWEVEFQANESLLEQTHVETLFVYLVMAGIAAFAMVMGVAAGHWLGHRRLAYVEHKRLVQQMRGSQQNSDSYVDPLYQQTMSILDVDIAKEDEGLLGLDDEAEQAPAMIDEAPKEKSPEVLEGDIFPQEVFRAYDIRGVAHKQITKDFAQTLGKALGGEVLDQRENTLVVARDARVHSPELTEWLIRGILSTGCNVLNIGTVPTPLMYFTLETMEEVSSGVVVTASHNSAEYNGFKMVMNGVSRSESDIQSLRLRMMAKRFSVGQGQEHHHDIIPSYIDTIFSDVALAGELNVVVDAGNAVPGVVAPRLFEELGCRVTPLYCDLDGTFPNHNPDTSRPENLADLIAKVKEVHADLGIALDGDGDRITVISPTGKIIWADRLLMLFAKDIISRSPGADVIFDVKSTRHLNSCITNYGGRPVMWKTGHSFMKQKMQESGAVVGAEYSGHIFIKDRWFGFDDGMYAAARLLEVLSLQGDDLDTAFAEFPESIATPEIRIPVSDDKKFSIVEQLAKRGNFGDGRLTLIDGIRADFARGWGLIRASNTGSELTMRFEADDEETLHKLKALFVRELRNIDNSIDVNWDQ